MDPSPFTEDEDTPRWTAHTATDVTRLADHWLHAPALRAIVRAGEGPPPTAPAADLLTWSTRVLDTRRGHERHLAPEAQLSPPLREALFEHAPRLGLTATHAPALDRYDDLLVLGGTTTGNQLRVELARTVVNAIDTDRVVGLGSHRLLTRDEDPAVEPDLASEWEDLATRLRITFHGSALARLSEAHYGVIDARPATSVLVAGAPGRTRANTADQVRDFATARTDKFRALVVTSSIYVPYQFFTTALIAMTAGAAHWELIGTPTSKTGSRGLLTQRLAQETHAAIQAATAIFHAT